MDWIPYDGTAEEFQEAGLLVPGVAVELDNGRRLLVGDVNDLWGVCDDCRSVSRNQRVVRYAIAIIWSADDA